MANVPILLVYVALFAVCLILTLYLFRRYYRHTHEPEEARREVDELERRAAENAANAEELLKRARRLEHLLDLQRRGRR